MEGRVEKERKDESIQFVLPRILRIASYITVKVVGEVGVTIFYKPLHLITANTLVV